MDQPNLGKRISGLRKAKGLTQEELAGQCKVSARTLQRIESDVVTPRAYTVRVIFAALGCNLIDFQAGDPQKDNFLMKRHFKQACNYLKDLFNLKTNTMKKVSILSVYTLAVGFGLFALCSESKAQKAGISEYVSDYNSRGTTYLYPRKLSPYRQYIKEDTINYLIGNYLIQEYKMNIYLNKEFIGRVDEGDTVKLDKGTWFKKTKLTLVKGSYAMRPLNTKNIVYIFPLNKPSSHGMKNDEYEIFRIDDSEIKEAGNKIYLNGVYRGEAFAKDTVILRPRGTLIIKNSKQD